METTVVVGADYEVSYRIIAHLPLITLFNVIDRRRYGDFQDLERVCSFQHSLC